MDYASLNYCDLLNSEAESPVPYDFTSSQYGPNEAAVDDTYVEDLTIEETPSHNSKKVARQANFTIDEDKLLVSAWLNTSLDPVRGSEQKKGQYWIRIADYFEKNKKWSSERTDKSLNARWAMVSKSVSKFCGYHSQISSFRKSGYTEQDKVVETKEMYKKQEGNAFLLDHCWIILRFQQKWIDECHRMNAKHQFKARKTSSPSDMIPTSADIEDDGREGLEGPEPTRLKRPIGRKAAKRVIQMAKGKELNSDVTDNDQKLSKKQKVSGNGDDVSSNSMYELENFRERKLESDRIRAQQMELLIATEQRNVALREKEIEIQSQIEDAKIMEKDTSLMPPLQAQYFISLQKKILAKIADNGENR